MRRPSVLAACAIAVLGVACAGVASARADGLPVLGVDAGGTGVGTSSGTNRYVTIPAGPGKTVIASVERSGGTVDVSTLLQGSFTIPAVAYDGSASGLAADGKTLVLIEPRAGFPRAETRLLSVAVSAAQLRPLRQITLHGDFSFDAISPHGALLYLIQYVSPTDPNRYLVRAYDVRAGQLLAAPVRDPRELEKTMHGWPVTRTSSPDGRWAFTLYDGLGKTPFVHALDTSRRRAHCVDLAALVGIDLSSMRLAVDTVRHMLVVRKGPTPIVQVDTRTFAVSAPQLPGGQGTTGHGRVFLWPLVALSILGVVALGVVFWRRPQLIGRIDVRRSPRERRAASNS